MSRAKRNEQGLTHGEAAQLIVLMKAIMLRTNLGDLVLNDEDLNRAHLGYDMVFNRAEGVTRVRLEERRDD